MNQGILIEATPSSSTSKRPRISPDAAIDQGMQFFVILAYMNRIHLPAQYMRVIIIYRNCFHV
jgi:hypothetical protein